MENNDFNSNISPLEMAEMNNRDAKQIDVALGVILNEMPSKIASIKQALDNAETKVNSLKTRKLIFNVSEDIGSLAKKYDAFSQEVINYSSYYELEIVKIINIFDRQNSLDGSSTVDNNYFKNLPFLGTVLFTFASYYGNGHKLDDLPQFALDSMGNWLDKDFNESIGNLIYNGTEYLTEAMKWNWWIGNGLGAVGLITVESLYDLLYANSDNSVQSEITLTHATADGCKLLAGNVLAKYVAIPAGEATAAFVGSKLAGFAGAKLVGGLAGGVVGAGVVVVSEITIELVVEPIVAEITGEAPVYMTSIPKNGGLTSLYSDYVKSISSDDFLSYGSLGRTTSLYGMTASSEYCHEMAQLSPIETLYGLDDYGYSETSYSATALENYIGDLKTIPKDSVNFQEQVEQLTANALVGDGSGYGTDYIRDLIYNLDFDPVSYAMNN